MSIIRQYHKHKMQTKPWYREEEPHNNHETPGRQTKQSNQLSLSHQDDCKNKMDKWIQSNAQQNIEQLQNPTMGVTINNESTTTEPWPWNGQQQKPLGGGGAGLICIFWYQIFALNSAVVEV